MSETFTFTFLPDLEKKLLDFCDRHGIAYEVENDPTLYGAYEVGFTDYEARRAEGFIPR